MLTRFVLLCVLVGATDTARKRWVGGSTWTEPQNWATGLPTPCDAALLESNQIMNIAGQANIAEISFSGDSAVIFDSFSEISFGQGSPGCNEAERNVKFYEAEREDFLAVGNWEYYSDSSDSQFDDLHQLDVHRIPCTHDIIEIPYREMRAELKSPVEVGAVKYGGSVLAKEEVVEWLNSPHGRNELRLLAPLHISDAKYCKRRGGCPCGNVANCNSTVCREQLLCNDPITTPVMCCSYCGSLLTMPVNYGESYRQLELEVSTILSQQTTPQAIQMGIENDILYMVVQQRGEKSTAPLSDVIIQHLTLNNYTNMGQIEVLRSTVLQKAAPMPGGVSRAHTTNSVLLAVLACLLVCLVACGCILVYVVRRKNQTFMPIQRTDFQPGACNAYDTLDASDHIYESIRVVRLSKSSEYYPTPLLAYSEGDVTTPPQYSSPVLCDRKCGGSVCLQERYSGEDQIHGIHYSSTSL